VPEPIPPAAEQALRTTVPRAHVPLLPARRLAVLTCMDARLEPLGDLGLEIGDAHVIRNAGGRATDDALRSLLFSWHLLGTREVQVVHHTQCGAHTEDLTALRTQLGALAGVSLDGMVLEAFTDQRTALLEDLERIRAAPFAPDGLRVRGAIHDVASGRIEVVEAAAAPPAHLWS